jgi:preprotein translocase subunit SecE
LNGWIARVGRYVREVRNEARKVVWLTRRQTLTYTAVVVVATAVLAAFMYGFDILLTEVAKGFVALV